MLWTLATNYVIIATIKFANQNAVNVRERKQESNTCQMHSV